MQPTLLNVSNSLSELEHTSVDAMEERGFYSAYGWCLNVSPTIRQTIGYLREELAAYQNLADGWQRSESAINIFLLACSISDAVDDFVLGTTYDFSKVTNVFSWMSPFTSIATKGLRVINSIDWPARRRVVKWRKVWESAVNGVLRSLLLGDVGGCSALEASSRMRSALAMPLPPTLLRRCPRIPAAFRSQDLTHFDVTSLGQKFVATLPDHASPILVVGLRTAGSYFAPLLRAYLETQGYADVDLVTLRPNRGASASEKARIRSSASKRCRAVIIDEPIASGRTLSKAVAMLNCHGIANSNVTLLMPVHRSGRNWRDHAEALSLAACEVLTLEPEEWYKQRYVNAEDVRRDLARYFQNAGGSVDCQVLSSEEGNKYLEQVSEGKYHTRLKRVFVVRHDLDGTKKYVLAKSVGWGWLGYHAFVAGQRLAAYVPNIIGQRNGFLFTEWIPRSGFPENAPPSPALFGEYVGARANHLRLEQDETFDLKSERQLARGLEELASALGLAYGKAGGILKRARIRSRLVELQSHQPALIDGRMRRIEWVQHSDRLLKADFEHHGMGKHQLNLTDPAFDLADVILHWQLSSEQERELLAAYVRTSGDLDVYGRLFLHKVLAGLWSMDRAVENLNDPAMLRRHEEFNHQYVNAWNFLTQQAVRFCAGFCSKPKEVGWHSPVVMLDVDGVIDKKIFNFPSTTAAGMQAISLLQSHGYTIALNTARSIAEVKEYCRAYGFAGGVAEYGAYVWDAVTDSASILISDESYAQIKTLENALRQIPGVFLNNDYKYSIRAYTYDKGVTVALPKLLVENLIAELKLDRLKIHRTFLDTAIVAGDTDKGVGLVQLLRLADAAHLEVNAFGDSASDLPMFKAAHRSFAPGHIGCGGVAKQLGCRIASTAYQPGFLESVRFMIHPDGSDCKRCRLPLRNASSQEQYFLQLLRVADGSSLSALLRAMLDPKALQTFAAD